MDLQLSNLALEYTIERSRWYPVGMGTKQDTQIIHLLIVLLSRIKLYIQWNKLKKVGLEINTK
jgi:hypothetical protein